MIRRRSSLGDLLWEWNGTDTSQFDTPFISSTNNPGTWALQLTTGSAAVSPQVGGTRLSVLSSGSGVTGEHWGIFPILETLPQSFEVVINSDFINTQDTNSGYGFFIWGDLDAEVGYVWHPEDRGGRIDGTLATTNSAGTARKVNLSGGSGQMNMRVEGRIDAAGGAFGTVNHRFVFGTNSEEGVALRNQYDANDGDWNITAGLPPAAWDGSAANRFGLALLTTGGGGGIPDWYINSIKIYALESDAAVTLTAIDGLEQVVPEKRGGTVVTLTGTGFDNTALVEILLAGTVVGTGYIVDADFDVTPTTLIVGLPALDPASVYDLRVTVDSVSATLSSALAPALYAEENKVHQVRQGFASVWDTGPRILTNNLLDLGSL